jgi:hypothetical protein
MLSRFFLAACGALAFAISVVSAQPPDSLERGKR